jgi:hypothetical protein
VGGGYSAFLLFSDGRDKVELVILQTSIEIVFEWQV